ncbi:hypothetical protein TFLX_04600 [Thermoflexales bacterium]|nr:hypothetical protein TFLX_04600 [Thermoflexales bacterium]
MERQQIEEWRILEKEALRTLRDNDRQDSIRFLQILTIPAFESAVSYEIRQAGSPRHATRHFGVIARWRRDIDIAKFETPVERLKYPVSLSPSTRILSALRK